jgi:peptidoglycan-associated lipoprotein
MTTMTRKLFLAIAAMALISACSSTSDDANSTSGANSDVTRAGLGSLQEQLARVGDRVFFETDQYDLSSQSRQTIQGWSQLLRQNPNVAVTLEGHADERGTREYNLALGERRAAETRRFLASLGINNRVNVISYGKERPANAASNPDGWAENRRSVIVVQ